LVAITPVELTDEEQAINASERKEIDQAKRRRRDVRTFSTLGINAGATLTFTKDDQITCTVVSNRKVFFQGEELSPSAAALKVVHGMGYKWPAVSGMDYWEYEGVKLSQIGDQGDDDELTE